MKKLRTYLALLDDGHDYKEFSYTSEHRAGSRQNRDDCRRQYRAAHGSWAEKRIIWDRFRCQLECRDC